MFRDRVAHHFHEAGWAVEPAPAGAGGIQADLRITKGARSKLVLVRSDEPPGPFEIARFGAACRALATPGIVVAPDDPENYERYEQAGLEFVPGEGIGDVVVLGHAPPPPPLVLPTEPPPVPAVEPPAPARAYVEARPTRTVLLRWAVVALIWAAAIATIVYDVRLYAGR